jgi:hypothetical protein
MQDPKTKAVLVALRGDKKKLTKLQFAINVSLREDQEDSEN